MELDTGHYDAPKASIAACIRYAEIREGLFRVEEGEAEPDVPHTFVHMNACYAEAQGG